MSRFTGFCTAANHRRPLVIGGADDLVAVAQITVQVIGVGPLRAHQLGRLLPAVVVDIADHDRAGVLPGHLHSRRPSDSLGGTGNQADLLVEQLPPSSMACLRGEEIQTTVWKVKLYREAPDRVGSGHLDRPS